MGVSSRLILARRWGAAIRYAFCKSKAPHRVSEAGRLGKRPTHDERELVAPLLALGLALTLNEAATKERIGSAAWTGRDLTDVRGRSGADHGSSNGLDEHAT